MRTAGQRTGHDLATSDVDLRRVATVTCVKVRRRMVCVIHLDNNAVKLADPGHGADNVRPDGRSCKSHLAGRALLLAQNGSRALPRKRPTRARSRSFAVCWLTFSAFARSITENFPSSYAVRTVSRTSASTSREPAAATVPGAWLCRSQGSPLCTAPRTRRRAYPSAEAPPPILTAFLCGSTAGGAKATARVRRSRTPCRSSVPSWARAAARRPKPRPPAHGHRCLESNIR